MATAISRRGFLSGAALVATARAASAQSRPHSPSKTPAIGYMSFGPVARGGLAGSHEGFLRGLQELGYVPGQNITIEYRHASGRVENLPQAARELLDLHVDVVLAVGAKDVDALLKLSRTVPIVTVYVPDVVGLGYAETLARPGRNVTGFTTLAGEMTAKWLEIFKELRPGLGRVGVLWDLGMGPPALMDTGAWRPEQAFRANGVRRHPMPVGDPADLAPAFEAARREGVGTPTSRASWIGGPAAIRRRCS